MSDPRAGSYSPANSQNEDSSTVKQTAAEGARAAGQAGAEVKDTAVDQAQRVAAETKNQVRSVAADVRDKLGAQAHEQNGRLVSGIRETADQLDEMRGDRADSPAAAVVTRVADGGRQLADYLDRNGPDGVLREVQDFARRRPGAFLATALAAGFVVGRLGKSVAKADPDAGQSNAKPSSDAYTAGTPGRAAVDPGFAAPVTTAPPVDYTTAPTAGYPGTSTEYAATGSGTPIPVDETYPPVVPPAETYAPADETYTRPAPRP